MLIRSCSICWLILLFLNGSMASTESTNRSLSNFYAKRLFEHLVTGYNRLIRPVEDNREVLTVKFKLKLSQLIDIHEKNQIMTTNVWLHQEWTDYKFRWDPAEFGNVTMLHIPADMIWIPDIVLYNNADGKYQVRILTKATVFNDGRVVWEPPAIYKSMCEINVMYFPFDEQFCTMKFGSWTYDGFEVDIVHLENEMAILDTSPSGVLTSIITKGVDLSGFYPSVEWDIMAVPGVRHEVKSSSREAPYIDVTFMLNLRRKTLFYTVNLIIPCVGISFLTVLVFYLPSDSGEKVVLCISILICLTLFFLLLVEIIPSTSMVVPLIAKYLLFTMVLVTVSIATTVMTLNVHHRTNKTHNMPDWVRKLFLYHLPPFLYMQRMDFSKIHINTLKTGQSATSVQPANSASRLTPNPFSADILGKELNNSKSRTINLVRRSFSGEGVGLLPGYAGAGWQGGTVSAGHASPISASQGYLYKNTTPLQQQQIERFSARSAMLLFESRRQASIDCPDRTKEDSMGHYQKSAVDSAQFIASHMKARKEDNKVKEEWRYVALVLDRMFLVVFLIACAGGTIGIIFQAPVIYDQRVPIVG